MKLHTLTCASGMYMSLLGMPPLLLAFRLTSTGMDLEKGASANFNTAAIQSGVHTNSSLDDTSSGTKICCAWKMDLGIWHRKRPWDSEHQAHWDFSGAKSFCDSIRQGQHYQIVATQKTMLDGFDYAFQPDGCDCKFAKSRHYVGQPSGTDGKSCTTTGPVGAQHCKAGSQQVFACQCILTKEMFCLSDPQQNKFTLLFAPAVKSSGLIFNCGSPTDKNIPKDPYVGALANKKATTTAHQRLGIGEDPVEEPAQKLLATYKDGAWEYREKYGGSALLEKNFCPPPGNDA